MIKDDQVSHFTNKLTKHWFFSCFRVAPKKQDQKRLLMPNGENKVK